MFAFSLCLGSCCAASRAGSEQRASQKADRCGVCFGSSPDQRVSPLAPLSAFPNACVFCFKTYHRAGSASARVRVSHAHLHRHSHTLSYTHTHTRTRWFVAGTTRIKLSFTGSFFHTLTHIHTHILKRTRARTHAHISRIKSRN